MDLSTLSPLELMQLQASCIEELKSRDIVRTNNNPLGDYAEYEVAGKLNLTLATASAKGYDAITEDGKTVQIKSCRKHKTVAFSVLRDIESQSFDYCVAVVYDERYNVIESFKFEHSIIQEIATYKPIVNGWQLRPKAMREHALVQQDII